jgi:Uma2 family endonuclease
VQKVSPKRRHALLQSALSARLVAWAAGRGEVGSEWRFRLAPPGEVIRPLVPDLAYLSYERAAAHSDEELDAPLLAPDVAIEIRSPADRQDRIDHKIAVYLACGTKLVLIVDPETRRIDAHDTNGVTPFDAAATFSHPALSGLAFPLAELFAIVDRPR